MPRRRPPAAYLTRRRWTMADGRAALAAWEASGRSPHDFARETGLHVKRLYRWRRRIEAECAGGVGGAAKTPEFVELGRREAEPVEVVLRSGRVLRVAATIEASVLLGLVRVLEEEPGC